MNNPAINRLLRSRVLMPLGAVLILLASGCSTVKKAPAYTSTGASGGALAQVAPAVRFDSLTASYADWDDVALPVRLSITRPKAFSVTAQCTMKHNQWVLFSVRMLGFEVAKVWLDNDSVHAVDKYHKRYLSESLQRFLGCNDVTIGNFQDMLLGRAFLTGKSGGTLTPASSGAIRMIPSPEGLMILPAAEPQDFNYGFILDNSADCLAAASVTIGESTAVVINYATYYSTPAGAVSSVAAMQTMKGKPVDLSLTWNLQSAKWNRGVTQQWTTPKGYTRMATEQLLKLLQSF